MIFLFDLIAFLVVLTVPGYLLVDRHFQGLEKAVLSVFLSLAVTSFLFYAVVSFFGISKEFIYAYAFLLLIVFFVIKKPKINRIFDSIKKVKLIVSPLKSEKIPELLLLFLLVLFLSLTAFFIPINKTISYDDSSYHLPIINDVAVDGQKTFFSETHNIYQVRSNQFPLLFESFVGTTKFFLGSFFYWLVSFFSLIISLFLIYFISKEVGYNQFFSLILYGLTPLVLLYTGYFGVENFLSLFFLGAVFFVLKYVKSENLFFVVVAGFLAGLMFLTKFTGGIFFAGLFLFLLYKHKFKPAFLFGLIFVLVSLVFFVSHLGVPFDQISVGNYGNILSDNPLIQIFPNIFWAGNWLIYYFSDNTYILLVPVLFVFGLFLRKQKENDFLVLFLISLILFLGITFINNATPTRSGFPRYFLPIYSLLCVFSGFQLKKLVELKNKKISLFFTVFFVLMLLLISLPFMNQFNIKSNGKSFVYVGKGIENDSNITAWFLNNAGLQVKLDKAVVYDYVWRADFSGNPCEFLKEHKINYIVYYRIDNDPDFLSGSPDYLGDFGPKLRESLLNNDCSELISTSDPSNNALTFKIIHAK